jgi:hypothetical protein
MQAIECIKTKQARAACFVFVRALRFKSLKWCRMGEEQN